MSEGSEDNSSIIPTNEECRNNSSIISSSKGSTFDVSTSPNNDECDAATVSTKLVSEIISTYIPMSEESQISRIDDSKVNLDKTLTSDECKINSSTISTIGEYNSTTITSSNDDSKMNSSTIPITEGSSYTVESTEGTSYSVESTEETETNSSRTSYQHEIEESILKMIKHIEQEIESDQHVDLYEDDFQSVEIKIKTSRVLVAIEQTIRKLEIAFCLQWIFVENLYDIRSLCGEENMNQLINDYCKIRDVDDMDICRFQPIAINCINNAFTLGLGRFVDLHRHKLPESETKLLSTMVQFKCMAEWQMGMSAIKAMNKEKTLHKMWTANQKIKSKINEMENQYKINEKKLQELLDEKNNMIAAHNRTISDLEKRNTNEINAEIYKSNKVMRRVCVTSEEKQKILTAELHQIKETYEKLVQNNLLVEKKLRDQKSKTRQKLQAVLTKYDTGVGERFAELMRIRNELEEETVLYENKVKDFQLQEIEYNQIMADKAEVDAKIREEKLLLFMMNRSARIIQRAYKKMMKKRKKGKKGKKGKKTKAKK